MKKNLRIRTRFFRQIAADQFLIYWPGGKMSSSDQVFRLLNNDWKLSPRINKTQIPGEVMIATSDVDGCMNLLDSLNSREHIKNIHRPSGTMSLVVPHEKFFRALIESPVITFIDKISPRAKEETLNGSQDMSVNKINYIHHLYPALTGEGLTCSVKEQLFDVGDIDLKGRIKESSLQSTSVSLHANQMATIIAGGGNTSPQSRGAAWKAAISSSSFDNLLPDDIDELDRLNVKIQNHSYGTEIENFYGAEAKAYDVQMNQNPSLVHVFSSGNKGIETPSDGPFAGMGAVANLTGNFKMSKNSLVVGAHYNDYSVDERNSKGPAYDGRIKPEVIAYGMDGTSDGAAMVSGLILLLQHQYMLEYEEYPSAALLKSILITTATDAGRVGIDHQCGYGAINADRAVELIRSGRFIGNEINGGEVKTFSINVPANTESLKVSVSWNDPAAEPGSSKGLINDIDMYLQKTGSNVKWLPWVLSHYPHADSLSKLPQRKKDRLNNNELVSIDNPDPGEYIINIEGSEITGTQEFYITYEIRAADSFSWTYPTADDPLIAGSDIYLRWSSTKKTTGSLEMSIDNAPFESISSSIDLSSGFMVIQSPPVTGTLILRMKAGTDYFYSDPVVIADEPDLRIGFNCEESFMLSWPNVDNAQSYNVYSLGERYMELVKETSDTAIVFPKKNSSFHFAVAPVVNGGEGLRSYTYDYRAQGTNCYFKTLAAYASTNGITLQLMLSTLYNIEKVIFERKKGESFEAIGQIIGPEETTVQIDDPLQAGGIYYYRAKIILADGGTVYTPVAEGYYTDQRTYKVFPNPVMTSENLKVLTDGNDITISFFDLNGKLIFTREINNSYFDFPVSGLVAGVYAYRIFRSGSAVSFGKIIVLQ